MEPRKKNDESYENPNFVRDERLAELSVKSPSVQTFSVTVEDTSATEESDDDRDTFPNAAQFLCSCISMSVGLGNVWRFPGVCAANGGAAFLFPYLVVLLLIGRPMYYLELCVGQFTRQGQVKIWHMAPFFKGVGYASAVAVICICTYYCSIMAITLYYFLSSFSTTLPWTECHQDQHPHLLCNETEGSLTSLYFKHTVFPQLDNINNGLGSIHWNLAACLAASWFLIFLSLAKGIKSSGKVAYFTAIFPYTVLLILLIRGVTLPGAWEGIKILLGVDQGIRNTLSKILEPQVWYAAVEQCFFSLSVGQGMVIMFSSYNKFRQNIYRDAMIISFMDSFTSILAGVIVFAVIGNLMHANNVSYETLKDLIGGHGLVFILYPQAISNFWFPQAFSVLFFLMFFTLGLGSATAVIGSLVTVICDQFPSWKRWLVTLVISVSGTLVGLMYVTEGGGKMVDLVDHYGAGFVSYVIVITECVGIVWIYGLENLCNDIEFMLGRKTGIYWRACWGFIVPVGLGFNLMYYLINHTEFKSGNVAYPVIATVCGWLLTTFCLSMIPLWAIHAVVTRKANTLKEKFLQALQPTAEWGPKNRTLYSEWLQFRELKSSESEERKNPTQKLIKSVKKHLKISKTGASTHL